MELNTHMPVGLLCCASPVEAELVHDPVPRSLELLLEAHEPQGIQ